MIKRPLAGMAIALIAGICLYQIPFMTLLITTILMAALLLSMEIPWIKKKLKVTKEDRHRYLWPVFLMTGYVVMNKAVAPVQIMSLLQEKDQVTLTGYITDMNVTTGYTRILLKDTVLNQKYHEDKVLIYITIPDDYTNEVLKAEEGQDVISNSKSNALCIGNQIEVTGSLHWPRQATNDGQFDEKQYYDAQKIHAIVYATSLQIIDSSIWHIRQTLYSLRSKMTSQLSELLPEKEAGLLSAILLGEKETLSEELKKLYQENGFAHIMAISGLHISLIGYGLYMLGKKLTLPVWLRCLLPAVILLFYGALIGSSVSAKRAIFMFLLSMLALTIGRSYDGLSAISLSAIYILLTNPLSLFTAGFLFSYAAVLGILLIYPVLVKVSKAWEQSKVITSILFSLSIQLALLGLQCFFYYEISLYSLIPNLILLPLCSLLVGNAMFSCMISFLSVSLGRFLIAVSYYLLLFFELVLKFLSNLPYHLILTGCPAKLQLFAYYVVLIVCLLILLQYKKRYCMFGFLLLLPLLFHYKDETLVVTALDVGQGDCIVLSQGNHTVLVDGGSTDVSDVYEYRIKPFLKYHRISSLDAVVVTHSDQDHICGIEDMISEDDAVNMLYVPLVAQNTTRLEELVSLAKSQQIPVKYLTEGDSFYTGRMSYVCLNPKKDADGQDTNEDSVVLWMTYYEFDLLLMADTTIPVEERILATYEKQLKQAFIEGIKAGHHGSDYSTGSSWLTVTNPVFAILSYGKNNRYGHPGVNMLQRLGTNQVTTYSTASCGAITIRSDGQNWLMESHLQDTIEDKMILVKK